MNNDLAVLLDTNAYRDLCDKVLPVGQWTIPSVRASEQQKGIVAYANPYVIMELASHLWDENDPAYAECRCALSTLYRHCCTDAGDQIRVLADAESLVAQILYQRVPPAHAETTQRLSRLARAVADAAPGSFTARIQDACKEIGDELDRLEGQFVQDMRDVVLDMNPAAADWKPYAQDKAGRQQALSTVSSPAMRWRIALIHVLKARNLLGIPRDSDGTKEMADQVLEQFGPSVALYQEILKRIVSTGCDVSKKKRANWLWDMQIAMGVGEEVGEPPKRITLVTGDGAIVEAAKAASVGASVMSLDEYLTGLAT